MTTLSGMRERLRALWEAAERVSLMRLAGNKAELDTALTVRNDAVLSVELAFSALHKENARLQALVEKLHGEATLKLTATIDRNNYGGFFAWLRGWGYPQVRELPDFEREPRAAEDALDKLVSNGYELLDPDHLIDIFDLFDEPMGAEAMDYETAEMVRSNRGPVVTAELAGTFTPRCDDF